MGKKGLASIVLRLAIFGGFILSFFFGLRLSPYYGALTYVLSLLFAVAGLIIGFLLHSLLHETGHAIGAKVSGAKLTALSIAAIDIDLTGGKPKLSLDFKSVYAGVTSFVCPDPQKADKTLKNALIGGLIGSTVSILICFAGLFFGNYYVYYLLFSGAFAALYMTCVNFVVSDRYYDGTAITELSEFSSQAFLLAVESYLYNGSSLAEIDYPQLEEKYPDRSKNYYDVLRNLETGDLGGAQEVADKLIEDQYLDDNEYIAAYFERFFIAVMTQDEDYILKNAEEFLDLADDSLTFLRAQAAYLAFKGDYEWGAKVASSFIKTVDLEPFEGYKKTERNIWNRYLAAKE